MLLMRTEFFSYEQEIWYRLDDGTTARLCESDIELISALHGIIEEFYPKAYAALCSEYDACKRNITYFRFRVVSRFLRCNFAALDNVPDLVDGMFADFEYVTCPLRGECRLECVVCRPEFNHKLSNAETRVMELWYKGAAEDEIASALCLSPHTVHNHIRNAYVKLDIHSRAEFVRFANANGLFK